MRIIRSSELFVTLMLDALVLLNEPWLAAGVLISHAWNLFGG
jgi:hypothetical protein